MNILHEKRKAAGHMANDPITAFIIQNATVIATSAAIGAVGAAVKGGNILKGALFGAILGGVGAGISNMIGGGTFLGGAAADSATAAIGADNMLAVTDAANAAQTAGTLGEPIGGMVGASDFAAADALGPSGLSTSTATGAADAALQTTAASQPSQYQLTDQGVGTTGTNTGIAGGLKANAGLGTTLQTTGLGTTQSGGLLSQITGSKLGATGLLVGGQMIAGAAQSKAAQQQYEQAKADKAWGTMAYRGAY